jgi:hypothetical protein
MAAPEGESVMLYINPVQDYEFQGFAGVDNCDYCDSFTHVNEWVTPEGAPHFVCGRCEFEKQFKEIK